MKSDLSNAKFQEIEKICLLLDILIDCEEYDEIDSQLSKLKELNIHTVPDKEEITNGVIKGKIKELDKIHSFNDVNCFKIILTSKYVRKLLKHPDTEKELATKAIKTLYKTLTEELLKKIPSRSQYKTPQENRDNQFRIIFLNEISAASESNLAIGYAEMALDELAELNEGWNLKKEDEGRIRHPYELYALYNKGLTYLHGRRDADQAIETLSQITSLFEKSPDKPNKKTKPFEKEYEEAIKKMKELYPICFWFFYIPSKHLIAEAYGDFYSNTTLEETVIETLKKIDNQVAPGKTNISTNGEEKLDRIIENYYRYKLVLLMIFSAIDRRDKDLFEATEIENLDWLNTFKENPNLEKIVTNLQENIDSVALNIKKQLESAKALFLMEYAKKHKDQDCFDKSLKICAPYLKEEQGTDWSDFAYTFLECVNFKLENDNHGQLDKFKDDLRKEYRDSYDKIFKKINCPEWIARKKDLVEKFLTCQEKLFLLYENEKNKSATIYILYQIELVNNILGSDSERRFKKKWPECEKEKLAKNLKETIKKDVLAKNLKETIKKDVEDWWGDNKETIKKDVEDWWGDNKETIKKDKFICSWMGRFENTIQDMKKKLSEDIYNLPEDIGSVSKFIQDKMNCDYYTKKLRLNTEQFNDHLIYKSCRPSLTNSYVLTVLRRWQSFTPALSIGSEVGHKGGGYFVYETNKKGEIKEGLVIDPGFDFLENFFDEGFSIRDINAVLITHSHRDHASDFMSIVTLVHEMNKKGKRVFRDDKWEEKKLILFITEGCHQNFAAQIRRNRDSFRDVIRIKQDTPPYSNKQHLECFRVEATKANHYDQSDHDSVGYIIKDKNDKELIGFTGDTQWYNNIEDTYKKCPVICMNMGGVVDIFKKPEIKLSDICNKDAPEHINNIKTILLRENHLYLPGFYLMAKKLQKPKPKLLILSELCEEMKGGLRTDLAEKISSELEIPVLPEDIGLTVCLSPSGDSACKVGHVVCKVCNSPEDSKNKNIVAVETSRDNAILYLCKKHYNQLKESNILPKINELELDDNELRNPIIKQNTSCISQYFNKFCNK